MLSLLIKEINTERKLKLTKSFFKRDEKILDFGCGDLSLAVSLKQAIPSLKITGIDTVDFGKRPAGIVFIQYQGGVLPFSDASFETVLSYHVFHHCQHPEFTFRECVRVASERIIMVEPIARHRLEIPGMKLVDWLFNIWKTESVALTFQFLTEESWRTLFKKYNVRIKNRIDVEILPKFFPTGRSFLFELYH